MTTIMTKVNAVVVMIISYFVIFIVLVVVVENKSSYKGRIYLIGLGIIDWGL